MIANPVLMETRDLRVHLPVGKFGKRGLVRAVDGVSLTIGRGEIVALVGESGCGKSTTGRALLRLVRPTSGTILFDGIDITFLEPGRLRPLRQRLQMIFQHPGPALNSRLTIARSIGEPLELGDMDKTSIRDAVDAMLDRVGLPRAYGEKYPHELSGGQLQRVAIARALVGRPDFVLADEPLSALDLSVQAQVVALLKALQSELGVSLLFITHDLAVAEYLSDRVSVMYLGKIVESAPARRFSHKAKHPYSKALLESVPRLDPALERARMVNVLSGEVPSAMAPPPGCRFQTRCPMAVERCRSEEPPLKSVEEGHEVACWLV
jgi:peptide/nickel transport system ATP-binding protein